MHQISPVSVFRTSANVRLEPIYFLPEKINKLNCTGACLFLFKAMSIYGYIFSIKHRILQVHRTFSLHRGDKLLRIGKMYTLRLLEIYSYIIVIFSYTLWAKSCISQYRDKVLYLH